MDFQNYLLLFVIFLSWFVIELRCCVLYFAKWIFCYCSCSCVLCSMLDISLFCAMCSFSRCLLCSPLLLCALRDILLCFPLLNFGYISILLHFDIPSAIILLIYLSDVAPFSNNNWLTVISYTCWESKPKSREYWFISVP